MDWRRDCAGSNLDTRRIDVRARVLLGFALLMLRLAIWRLGKR
jgi:hypothetical protein